MSKHITIDMTLWMSDEQYRDLEIWCAQTGRDTADWAEETLRAALRLLEQQSAAADRTNASAPYDHTHCKYLADGESLEGKVLVIRDSEMGSGEKIPEHQLFYALEDTGDIINGFYLYDYVPGQDMDCHSLSYYSVFGEISPEHLPGWAHAKLALMHGCSTELSFLYSAEIIKEMENAAKYAVDAAVRHGLEDRVTDEYILKFDDISANIHLEIDKKIIFDKLAMDALRAHPEVKDIELASDGEGIFVFFHQPFAGANRELQAANFNKLNALAPAFVGRDECYAVFLSPRDMTRLIELHREELDDTCVTMTQTVQSGGHRPVTDVRMELMLDEDNGLVSAAGLYREGMTETRSVYRGDNSYNHNVEYELNQFLSDFLDDVNRLSFERMEAATDNGMEMPDGLSCS